MNLLADNPHRTISIQYTVHEKEVEELLQWFILYNWWLRRSK